MKRFVKTPSCLALIASWALGCSAHAQTNTNTYYAELSLSDRQDVSVQTAYAPYGNKTDTDRYGDDGSAAIVDASGVIIWRTADGAYRALPNTQVSKPLFVSNSECIVWRNAYESDPTKRTTLSITYFRLNAPEKTVVVNGNKVLDTPVITTTSIPYTLITANVKNIPESTNTILKKNLFVYRLSYDAQAPQLLTAYTASKSIVLFAEFLDDVKTIAVCADGSQVVLLKDPTLIAFMLVTPEGILEVNNPNQEFSYVWIRNDGSVQSLFKSISEPFVNAAAGGVELAAGDSNPGFVPGYNCFQNIEPVITTVDLSATQFVFGSNVSSSEGLGDPLYFPIESLAVYSRSMLDVVKDEPRISTLDPGHQVLPLLNFTQKGFEPLFMTQHAATRLVRLYRLEGSAATALYSATLPAVFGTDFATARLNVTPGSESVAIRDSANQGIVWLHRGHGWNFVLGAPTSTAPDPESNYSLLKESNGVPLFVTPGEMIVWSNAKAAVVPGGALPPVEVNHYGRPFDAIPTIVVTELSVLTDATDPYAISPAPLRGSQVFSPFPFTQAPALWRLETGEKVTANSQRIRNYQLMAPENTDEDGDGILGGLEEGSFYVIPGAFTYEQAKTDAQRRGGHLATLVNAEELTRMQAALLMQQRNAPFALPLRTLPYPLWIGLELQAGTWQWQAETLSPNNLAVPDPAFITPGSAQWAIGEPSGVPTRTRGRLNSTQQWESISPTATSGYLLEIARTDKRTKDSDGDGANDYDELFRLITDPQKMSFPPDAPVYTGVFTNPATRPLLVGNYAGFLTQFSKGPISGFTLSVTKTGAYTGKISGSTGVVSIRGSFTSNGQVIALPVNLGAGLSTSLAMLIAPRDPYLPANAFTNPYRVTGTLTGLGETQPLVFEMRRAGYSKAYPPLVADQGLYTVAIPADIVPKEGLPSGDGYLTGSISNTGVALLRGKTSEGLALSWSGTLLEGDLLSFFSMFPSNKGFVGSNLFLRHSAEADEIYGLVGQSDLDGDLLVVRNAVTTGSTQNAGYGFRSLAYGSHYQQGSYAKLSVAKFLAQPNNAVVKFIDGPLSGLDTISTWSTTNLITIPKTQTRILSAKITSLTGELTGTYKYNDPAYAYANTTGTLSGVVLQKSGEVRGYYLAGTSSGQMVITPNVGGTAAPYNLISPTSKSISEFGGSYKIYLTSSEPWTVVNRAAGWAVVEPMSGTGSAVLLVSVGGNSGNLRRIADITIAGLTHNLNQDWNHQGGTGGVTITPVVHSVSSGGGSYQVLITGYQILNPTDFSSSVDWVTVTPAADLRSATVVVSMWSFVDSGLTPRTAIIQIAGVNHTVIQQAW